MGFPAGWTNIPRTPRTVEGRDASGPARAGSNSVLPTTDAVGEPDAGSLHRSNHWLEPATCMVVQASLLTEAEQQAQQCSADEG
jgi:hypothetical protein